MNAATNPLVTRYLRELERALSDLPRPRRREIVEEIREHIGEAATAGSSEPNEAELRTILDQVGDPESIATEARDRFGISRPKAGTLEELAIALLLIGGVVLPGVGWVAGAVLLWVSRVWSTRDKLIGTLLVPGGLALPIYLYWFAPVGDQTCSSQPGPDGVGQVTSCSTESVSEPWGMLLMVVVALIPIATAFYLGRRAWREDVS